MKETKSGQILQTFIVDPMVAQEKRAALEDLRKPGFAVADDAYRFKALSLVQSMRWYAVLARSPFALQRCTQMLDHLHSSAIPTDQLHKLLVGHAKNWQASVVQNRLHKALTLKTAKVYLYIPPGSNLVYFRWCRDTTLVTNPPQPHPKKRSQAGDSSPDPLGHHQVDVYGDCVAVESLSNIQILVTRALSNSYLEHVELQKVLPAVTPIKHDESTRNLQFLFKHRALATVEKQRFGPADEVTKYLLGIAYILLLCDSTV